jgi:hypothetical protein
MTAPPSLCSLMEKQTLTMRAESMDANRTLPPLRPHQDQPQAETVTDYDTLLGLSIATFGGLGEADKLDDEDGEVADLVCMVMVSIEMTGRNGRWEHDHLDWDRHVEKLLHEENFDATYQMSLEAYIDLCELLYPFLAGGLCQC